MGIQINGNTNNINAGIGSLSIEDLNELDIIGVATAANFKTGTSNLHSTGLNIFDLDVDGQTNLDHVSIAGVTTFGNNITASGTSRFEIASMENALLDGEIAHTGDTDTLIKFPSNDTITFETGGSERLRIASDGKVKIGNSGGTPDGKLHIDEIGNGDIVAELTSGSPMFTYRNGSNAWFHAGKHPSDDAFVITQGGTTTTTELLRITSSGRLGIGITNPSTELDVKGNIRMRQVNGNSGVNSDNIALYMGMSDDLNQGKTAIIAKPIGSWGRHDLYFCLDNAADLNDVGLSDANMVLTNDGTIGINETSPNSVLHVKHHNNNTADITIEGGGSGNAGIQFIPGGQTNSYFAYVDTNRNFRIQDHTSEKLRIVSGGNFSIGNPHGAKKIHISTSGNQKILIDPNYNNNSGGSSNSEANANNVVDSILVRTTYGDNAASQTNAGHKWGIKFQGYNGNDFTQNISKVAAVYAVSEDEAGGYNRNVGLTFHTSPYNTNHREAMRINTNGYVTKPYHPAFCATRNGGSHIQLANSSNTDVDFPSKDFDNSNSFNTSNSRFTAPVTGKYYFGVQFYCGFSVTSVRVMHAVWKKNGSNSHEADLFGGIGNFGNSSMNHYHPTTNAHVMLELTAGDYVTFNTGSPSFIGSGNTYLYATKGSRFFGYLIC